MASSDCGSSGSSSEEDSCSGVFSARRSNRRESVPVSACGGGSFGRFSAGSCSSPGFFFPREMFLSLSRRAEKEKEDFFFETFFSGCLLSSFMSSLSSCFSSCFSVVGVTATTSFSSPFSLISSYPTGPTPRTTKIRIMRKTNNRDSFRPKQWSLFFLY